MYVSNQLNNVKEMQTMDGYYMGLPLEFNAFHGRSNE